MWEWTGIFAIFSRVHGKFLDTTRQKEPEVEPEAAPTFHSSKLPYMGKSNRINKEQLLSHKQREENMTDSRQQNLLLNPSNSEQMTNNSFASISLNINWFSMLTIIV